MEFIKVYYSESGSNVDFTEEFALSGWYCKPAILSALAWYLECEPLGFKVLFLTCSKYGSRRFIPEMSESFPVSYLIRQDYKKDCPWVIIEFNDHVYDLVKDKSIFK